MSDFPAIVTLDKIEATSFERHIRQIFHAASGAYAAEWELDSVTLLGSAGSKAQRQSFSLVFKAPAGHRLSQGIYKIDHPELGTLEIFLVPIRANQDGFYLEAIFN
jgi:hypothetical protein